MALRSTGMGSSLDKCSKCDLAVTGAGKRQIGSGLTEKQISDVSSFKAAIKQKFGSINEAFQYMGNGDEAALTKDMFIEFGKAHLGMDASDMSSVFDSLNVDDDDKLTRAELKTALLGKGQVDLYDLRDYLQNMYSDPKEAFDGIDMNANKELELDEFSRFMIDDLKFPGEPRIIFQMIDTDGDAKLTWGEFKKTMLSLNPKRTSTGKPGKTGTEKKDKEKESKKEKKGSKR